MPLRQLAEGLHVVEVERATLGLTIPLRCTLLCLGDGSMMLHSPVAFDDDMASRIDALGKVSIIVAPNGFHHLYTGKAQPRWPNAELWASRALRKKAPRLQVARWFGEDVWPQAATVSACTLMGAPKVEETVFLHRESRTLVVTDLVFNILEPKGLLAGLVFRMFGTYRRFAASRLYRSYISDKLAFENALSPLFGEQFTRIVMAHGEIVEGEGLVERLRQVTKELCR